METLERGVGPGPAHSTDAAPEGEKAPWPGVPQTQPRSQGSSSKSHWDIRASDFDPQPSRACSMHCLVNTLIVRLMGSKYWSFSRWL